MKLVALAALATASLAARHADANCKARWVGTPTGTAIPQVGSLYVFDTEAHHGLAPRSAPIVRQTEVSDTVVRLDYVTKADEFELKGDTTSTVYQVHTTWKPPAAAPRVIQYWHELSDPSWSHPDTDAVWLQIDQPTAAFRVVWQATGQGKAREFILPAQTAEHNISVLPLGKLECAGRTIDPAELAAGGRLALFAIRFDGSEVAVSGLPETISTRQMPTSDDGLSRAIGYQAGSEPVGPLPPADHDWPFHLFLLLLIPATALLWVAVRDRSVKAVA